MRMVVVLPAPLLSTNPNTSPGCTENDTSSSACLAPNRLEIPPISSMWPTLRTRDEIE
jgi:hypothetical protein